MMAHALIKTRLGGLKIKDQEMGTRSRLQTVLRTGYETIQTDTARGLGVARPFDGKQIFDSENIRFR